MGKWRGESGKKKSHERERTNGREKRGERTEISASSSAVADGGSGNTKC